MKRLLLLTTLAALISAAAIAQTTVTIPSQVITIPQQVITIPAQTLMVNGTATPPVTCAPPQVLTNGVCTTPVVTPPPADGTSWIFHGGLSSAWSDYSYGSGKVSYTAKDPQTGETVISITGDEGLQPYVLSQDFDTTGYKFVLVSLKPLKAGQNWITGAEMKGDLPIPGGGLPPSITQYCSAFVVGQYTVCKIPLSAYGITPGLHILKVMFQQQQQPVPAGQVNWYAKDIGLSP